MSDMKKAHHPEPLGTWVLLCECSLRKEHSGILMVANSMSNGLNDTVFGIVESLGPCVSREPGPGMSVLQVGDIVFFNRHAMRPIWHPETKQRAMVQEIDIIARVGYDESLVASEAEIEAARAERKNRAQAQQAVQNIVVPGGSAGSGGKVN